MDKDSDKDQAAANATATATALAGTSPRILVIQVKRIGDLVVSAPLTAALRQQRPDAHITLLARGVAGKLASQIPGVDTCLVLTTGHLNLGIWWRLLHQRFDLVLDLSANDRSAFATLVSWAKTRATFAKWQKPGLRGRLYNVAQPGAILKRHMTDFYLGIVESVGLQAQRVPAALIVPDRDHGPCQAVATRVDEWKRSGRRLAVLHPGTAEANKYWQPQRWAAVIDHLAQQHDCIIVISRGNDPAELAHIAEIKALLHQPVDFDDFLTLRELVVVLHDCDIALGVDTGAMHVAASFEKSQVVLFGPSNWVQWGPRHVNSRLLRPEDTDDGRENQSMDGISTAAAITAVDELLADSAASSGDSSSPGSGAGASASPSAEAGPA